MALIQCPECGKEISSFAPACIHCGYPLDKEKESFTETVPEEEAAPESLENTDKSPSVISRLDYSLFRLRADPEKKAKVMNVIVKVWMAIAVIFVALYVAIELIPSMIPHKCAGCRIDLSDSRSFSYAGEDYCASCYQKEANLQLPCSKCSKDAVYYVKSSNSFLCQECYDYMVELNRILSGSK